MSNAFDTCVKMGGGGGGGGKGAKSVAKPIGRFVRGLKFVSIGIEWVMSRFKSLIIGKLKVLFVYC